MTIDDGAPLPVRLIFADDDPAMRTLLRATVGLLPAVEIVGEATDGVHAVELALEQSPDVALLDVNMPRVDGFQAAELITSVRPQTRILLHTAAMTAEKQLRARSLGIRLVDKMRLEELLDFARQGPVADGTLRLPDPIESLVLLALAEREGEGVVIVRPDRTVPYYNKAAADLLGLPFPARPSTFDAIWEQRRPIYADGRERPAEERPVERAFATGRPASDIVLLDADDRRIELRVSAVPFFGDGDVLLGVGAYLEPAPGELPRPRESVPPNG